MEVHDACIICTVAYQKVPVGLNSEKIKPVALAIMELKAPVSQSVWKEGRAIRVGGKIIKRSLYSRLKAFASDIT